MNATILPQGGPIPSSSRITPDDVITSPTVGFPHLVSSSTSFNFDNRHVPAQTHEDPNQSPSQRKKGKATQKRKASDALPPPESLKPPKMQKVGKGKPGRGNDTNGQTPWKPKNKKNRKRKGKAKLNMNNQSGPSNSHREEGRVEGEDYGNNGYAAEEGEIMHGGYGSGSEPEDGPTHPYGVDPWQ